MANAVQKLAVRLQVSEMAPYIAGANPTGADKSITKAMFRRICDFGDRQST